MKTNKKNEGQEGTGSYSTASCGQVERDNEIKQKEFNRSSDIAYLIIADHPFNSSTILVILSRNNIVVSEAPALSLV